MANLRRKLLNNSPSVLAGEKELKVEDYGEWIKIGGGSFGYVFKVLKKDTGECYAIK